MHGAWGVGALGRRIQHTGLKHNEKNKFQLVSQAEMFDAEPWTIIVPALDVDEVKAWTGEKYDAVVLVGRSEDGINWPANLSRLDVCTEMQLQQAFSLLKKFSIALAKDLLSKRNLANVAPKLPWKLRTAKKKVTRSAKLEETKKSLKETGSVTVLELKEGDFRAGKASFDCDPFLLAARAAVNLSNRLGHNLLPACAKKEAECPEDSECEGCHYCDMRIERVPIVPTFEEILFQETCSIVIDLDED